MRFLALIAIVFTVAVGIVKYPIFAQFRNQFYNSVEELENHKLEVEALSNSVEQAIRDYKENRTFNGGYDIPELLNAVNGITVLSSYEVNPSEYFSVVGEYTGGDDFEAVKILLKVEDVNSALKVINKIQLPIYSCNVNNTDNTIEFIYLGGV